jgi:CII-binding regulator of phage lambda lysogenization HflD
MVREMSDQTKSETENPSTAETVTGEGEAQVDLAAEGVLNMLQRATELAGGNSRYAVDLAKRMSDQLWAAQKRVAELQARVSELEADVQLYRDKSDRAEAWLGKISSEIQERVLGSPQ